MEQDDDMEHKPSQFVKGHIQGRCFVWVEDKWHGLKMPRYGIGKISRSETVAMEQVKL